MNKLKSIFAIAVAALLVMTSAATAATAEAPQRRVLNSTSVGAKIIGFAGPTPVLIHVADGIIERVELGDNIETESYIDEIEQSGLLESWNGMTIAEAATAEVDVVSGATYSSDAIIRNVKAVAQHDLTAADATAKRWLTPGGTIGSVVALLIALMVYLWLRSKKRE